LDTYNDAHSRQMNWSLMRFSAVANLSVWATMVLAALQTAVVLASLADLRWSELLLADSTQIRLMLVRLPRRRPAACWWGSSSCHCALTASLSQLRLGGSGPCPAFTLPSIVAWVMLAAAVTSCKLLCRSIIQLLNALSPTREPLPLSAVSHRMVWAAMLVQCLLQPVCVLATLLHSEIEWSGVKYWKRRGRITHIQDAGGKRRVCAPVPCMPACWQ